MQRTMIALSLCFIAGTTQAQSAGNCNTNTAPALPVQPTMIAPLSPELATPVHQLGAPSGVLAQAFDEALAVDNVLLRMRIESCLALAQARPLPKLPSSADPAAYQPKTQFDNTPWRFDMSQNGKRMTAEEFDAWMKARGVRVAKGAPGAVAAPAPAEHAEPDGNKK